MEIFVPLLILILLIGYCRTFNIKGHGCIVNTTPKGKKPKILPRPTTSRKNKKET